MVGQETTRWSPRQVLLRLLGSTFGLLIVLIAAMWVIEVIDQVSGDRLQRYGIGPRRLNGLDGILTAPLLHSDFGHLASNTVPLAVLGFLNGIRGRGYWLGVTLSAWLVGGALVWLLAGGSNHIGASGVAFGYLGALVAAAVRTRRPALLAPALVAIFLYGTMLYGLVPRQGISWEGHLFGLLAGAAFGYWATQPRRRRAEVEADDALYPWELDEPWLADDVDD